MAGTLKPAPSDALKSARNSWLILGATLGISLLLLLLLEFRWPYYFLQDDGLEYFLPAYFHNWHSLLTGRLPLYDFHIFAGVPHLAVGQTAVFYLPQYLAMFLSETIWGHPFAAIDLLAFMHALIAVAGGYVLLRYLGTTEAAASFGALCALSGFFVWAGRMWPNVPMLCAWFPWMVWAALRYLEKPGVARAGWLMFFRLGLLFGGQMQFFVLAMIFEHLFVLSYSLGVRQERWKARCLGYIAMDLPTALLGMPMLLPVWAEAGRSLERSRSLSYTAFSSVNLPLPVWLFGQLLVFIQVRVPKDTIGASLPYISYVGYIASLMPLGAESIWKKRHEVRPLMIACGVCSALAILWCTNLLGPLIFHVPVLNRFRWPFKLVFFAGFFQSLFAGLILMFFSRKWQRLAVAGFILNWIVVFCLLPNHAWRIRKHNPPLRSPWNERLKGGRYLVVDAGLPAYVSNQFVVRNYSEIWGWDNLLGYEPLVPHLNASELLGRSLTDMDLISGTYDGSVDQLLLIHLKKWSVKYVLLGPNRTEYTSELLNAGFKPEVVRQGWTLWEDPSALSRVRWGDAAGSPGSDAGIHWTEHVNSIDVTLDQWPGRQLVFAFVANHGLETCIAGHCNPVAKSADGLIRVDVPPGTRHVGLVYHAPYFFLSTLIALATLVVYGLLLLRRRRANQHGADYDMAASPAGSGPDAT